jgi:hypothetical protein
MKKNVKLETSNGNHYYTIKEYSGKLYVYKDGNEIGKCSSLEDALSVCKSDAGGRIYKTNVTDA